MHSFLTAHNLCASDACSVIADFCAERNWNLLDRRAPIITQSIEFAGKTKIARSAAARPPMNMAHAGTEVKKIRTPRYLEAGENFLPGREKSGPMARLSLNSACFACFPQK
ncbi:hypothetical protein [Paraburkholderia lycopersici]|uniref:hypothetical protein n=1 Tax=Paraburkholderia lycopersici TaxID=416944 RepID=UPI001160FE71|nr:hypothetical protein [Paraburkholderia lycopersici]